MIIAVASGKGGTGKTTLSLNLAVVAGNKPLLVDCDVEEPNCHLFFGGKVSRSEESNVLIPSIDPELCDLCGKCGKFCRYNAIAVIKPTPLVFPELCHSCGGCEMVCPKKAITEVKRRIGTVKRLVSKGIELFYGTIDVGVAMVPPLIRDVRRRIPEGANAIIDAPPGTSCPVIASLKGVDRVILVTEPTPFGLNDLSLAVDMVRSIGIPFGVVVNREGSGDDRVERFCKKEKIELLASIPNDRKIAEAYSRGELIVDALPSYRPIFEELYRKVLEMYGKNF